MGRQPTKCARRGDCTEVASSLVELLLDACGRPTARARWRTAGQATRRRARQTSPGPGKLHRVPGKPVWPVVSPMTYRNQPSHHTTGWRAEAHPAHRCPEQQARLPRRPQIQRGRRVHRFNVRHITHIKQKGGQPLTGGSDLQGRRGRAGAMQFDRLCLGAGDWANRGRGLRRWPSPGGLRLRT